MKSFKEFLENWNNNTTTAVNGKPNPNQPQQFNQPGQQNQQPQANQQTVSQNSTMNNNPQNSAMDVRSIINMPDAQRQAKFKTMSTPDIVSFMYQAKKANLLKDF